MKLFTVVNTTTGVQSQQGGSVNTFDNKAEAKACRNTLNMLWAEELVGRKCSNGPWRVARGADHRLGATA